MEVAFVDTETVNHTRVRCVSMCDIRVSKASNRRVHFLSLGGSHRCFPSSRVLLLCPVTLPLWTGLVRCGHVLFCSAMSCCVLLWYALLRYTRPIFHPVVRHMHLAAAVMGNSCLLWAKSKVPAPFMCMCMRCAVLCCDQSYSILLSVQ